MLNISLSINRISDYLVRICLHWSHFHAKCNALLCLYRDIHVCMFECTHSICVFCVWRCRVYVNLSLVLFCRFFFHGKLCCKCHLDYFCLIIHVVLSTIWLSPCLFINILHRWMVQFLRSYSIVYLLLVNSGNKCNFKNENRVN